MSIARHHNDWLRLVEVSGPFLSMPVLMRVFPNGLEAHDPERLRALRLAHEEWEENHGNGKFNPAVHAAWIRFVLTEILQLPPEVVAEGQAIPQTLHASVPEQGETLRPDLVIVNPIGGPGAGKPRLLIQAYPHQQDLDKPAIGRVWKASPATRMMELLHATGVRLGLVTNGERWMLVDAPKNDTTGFASWYSTLWQDEPITLRAFVGLLGVERFFNVPDSDTLEALLAESASNQQEVTDQLGYQVRRAVEVLVQSLDRADQDHSRSLLADVAEAELYEAALTVMMRLVFLFCAEERGLLLLDDELYSRYYAVSTVREQLRETADQHGEEILERRHDAWCRLLSTFRAVFGGVRHDRVTLPAYGGRLFDPDRFPFLEGRKRGTTWTDTPSDPLPVNNRTALHLLEALQILRIKVPGGGPAEARRLSFRALDIEQIGHVYEGLLDHTAKRATEPVLGLVGAKDKEPEVALSLLEELRAKGQDDLIEFLKDETGRSASALTKALTAELDLDQAHRLEATCGTDKDLWKRIQPFAGLIRDDTFGYPVVIRTGSVYVTAGTDRRSSGTHYTPRSLTEPIVQYTLEPLVYAGPAEGKPKDQWELRTAKELLDLKVCDMACGSGAFLVQACRYLSERLVEAWELAGKAHPGLPGMTPEGEASTGRPGELLIPGDPDERLAYARRVVAQRCLYGVDINPLAAEMGKLSLWLLTLAKDKPFTFLDHAIRCGDSLLGIQHLKQLKTFSLDGAGQQYVMGEEPLEDIVDEAIRLRLKIESMPSHTVEDVEAQAQLMAECEQRMEFLKCAADMLVAAEVKGGDPRENLGNRDHAAVQIGYYLKNGKLDEFQTAKRKALGGRRSFHWPLDFPEAIVRRGGFDAFIGNPPFMGGSKITGALGTDYRDYLVDHVADGNRGFADLCSYFLLRVSRATRDGGGFGLVATNTIAQGDTRLIGLDQLVRSGFTIYSAISSRRWSGDATVEVACVWLFNGVWKGSSFLDERPVSSISSFLVMGDAIIPEPHSLATNDLRSFKGTDVTGSGFILSSEEVQALVNRDARNRSVLFPFLTGEDINSRPDHTASRWVINFFDWPLDRSSAPEGYAGPVAMDYPDCLQIVVERVRPQRMANNRKIYRDYWWRFGERRVGLYQAIQSLKRVLVRSRVSNINSIVFAPSNVVFSDATVVFAFDSFDYFAILQSTIHTVWLEHYASSMRTDVRYTPSSCFDTFPMPRACSLQNAGKSYCDYRDNVLQTRGQGLTAMYNRFHDPEDLADDLQQLRSLHVQLDERVSAAYGWGDLNLDHGFHETRQGLRFTISDPARREVLARLLKLNHERYAEEVAQGLHDKGKKAGKRGKKQDSTDSTGSLF